jgi:AcrR family transcriptional regulator
MAEAHTDTQTRIFEAADELFCQFGYDGVSIRDVARLANVNKASVFYYFTSKEELFEEVLKAYYEKNRTALSGALEHEGPARERMHRLIDDYWTFMKKNSRYSRLVQGLLAGDEARLEAVKRTLAPLFNWTVEVLSEISPAEGPRAARHLYLTFVAAVVNYFTYTPALKPNWGADPSSETCLDERLEHLHWLVDLVLDDLLRD